MTHTHRQFTTSSPRHRTSCEAILTPRGEYSLPGSLVLVQVHYCPRCKLVIERCKGFVLTAWEFDPSTSPIRPVPEGARNGRL